MVRAPQSRPRGHSQLAIKGAGRVGFFLLLLIVVSCATTANTVNEELLEYKLKIATDYADNQWSMLVSNALEDNAPYVDAAYRAFSTFFELTIRTVPHETVLAYNEDLVVAASSHENPVVLENLRSVSEAVATSPGVLVPIPEPFAGYAIGQFVDGPDLWIVITFQTD